ncbi:MAG: hypothetical protein LW878_05500 [Proteobacteria bacterium]|nr:hypothetical protein [Pseudomonadota bacterium]
MRNKDCYCALCRTPRVVRYSRTLKPIHYAQVTLFTVATTWLFFPWLEFKALGSFFIYWAAFEFSQKTLYRRDLKCKSCGFDPTWYKRDVKVARRQVEEYLAKNPQLLQRNTRSSADSNFSSRQ